MSKVKTIGIQCKDERAEKEIIKLKKELKNSGVPLWTVEPFILIDGLKKALREKRGS
jgi:hypothetical protein